MVALIVVQPSPIAYRVLNLATTPQFHAQSAQIFISLEPILVLYVIQPSQIVPPVVKLIFSVQLHVLNAQILFI
jgi:hypothetical protein